MHRKEGRQTPPEFMITPTVTWADVVAPTPTLNSLVEFAGASAESRLALFVGDDRRARRLAAEALAHSLGSSLLRVDLSQVASKWLGEVEANFDRVFGAAESAGAVLLFDEADDLVATGSAGENSPGTYSETDRACFMRRLDQRRGTTLVAVMGKSSIDPAFVRRVHAEMAFPRRPR